MRLAFFAATALALTLILGDSALAWDCVVLSPAESFKNADVVFEGELLGITRTSGNSPFSVAYTFETTKVLKGPDREVIAVFGDGSDCDAQFRPGLVHRVYANKIDGKLSSGACSGNVIVSSKDVNTLHATVHYTSGRELWYVNALEIVLIGMLLGSGVFLWRKYVGKLP